MAETFDVVVVGAGIIGAATAYYCAEAGLRVAVVEKHTAASQTSSHCEGNLLVSDKENGPELELAKYSLGLWRGELSQFAEEIEFEPKGGLVVATNDQTMESLQRALAAQREYGIDVEELSPQELRDKEPFITDDAVGAAWYPQDSQLMPMATVNCFLANAVRLGARMYEHNPVQELITNGTTVVGVRCPAGDFHAKTVVNCTGPFAAGVSEQWGAMPLPVEPRRGYALVTQRADMTVNHKVYSASYLDNVVSSDGGLQTSPVVESTQAGTILIGSSRERVGFSNEVSQDALKGIAQNAIALFPGLSKVNVLRFYHGFRPYCADHVPIIGPDTRLDGLWHATGHEGAGIGLSAGTGKLISQALTGGIGSTDVPLDDFLPSRFETAR